MEIKDDRIDAGKAFDWGKTSHGRMRACRGVGASLSEEELAGWDKEHRELLLDRIAPEQFDILHYAALAVLKKK